VKRTSHQRVRAFAFRFANFLFISNPSGRDLLATQIQPAKRLLVAAGQLLFLWLVGLAFLLLMIASTTLDYLIAHAIARAEDRSRLQATAGPISGC
jgi:hypothetical protein